MIEQTVEELTPLVGTYPACRALGVAPATIYRRRRPPQPRPPKPRTKPARALSAAERATVLDVLHSERFVDHSPAQVWATLLDEGRYLASERTMYRLLAERGESRERRDQLVHPAYAPATRSRPFGTSALRSRRLLVQAARPPAGVRDLERYTQVHRQTDR